MRKRTCSKPAFTCSTDLTVFYPSKPGQSGVSISCRRDIPHSPLTIPPGILQGRVIGVYLYSLDLAVYSVYTQNVGWAMDKFPLRYEFDRALGDLLNSTKARCFIAAGDYNCCAPHEMAPALRWQRDTYPSCTQREWVSHLRLLQRTKAKRITLSPPQYSFFPGTKSRNGIQFDALITNSDADFETPRSRRTQRGYDHCAVYFTATFKDQPRKPPPEISSDTPEDWSQTSW